MHTFSICFGGFTSHPANIHSTFSILLAFATSESPHHSYTKPSAMWGAARAHSPHASQTATENSSRSRTKPSSMQSLHCDGGRNTTTTTNMSHSQYNTAFPHQTFKQWRPHTSSNYNPGLTTHSSTGTSKTSSAISTSKNKLSQKQALHPFGARSDANTYHSGSAALHKHHASEISAQLGRRWSTSPPTLADASTLQNSS